MITKLLKNVWSWAKAAWLRATLRPVDKVPIQLNNYEPKLMEVFASHAGTLIYIGNGEYWMKTPQVKGPKIGEVRVNVKTKKASIRFKTN